MERHRTTPTLPLSYQFRSRHTLKQPDSIFTQCTGKNADKARELFSQMKEDLAAYRIKYGKTPIEGGAR
jgi:hypothetical protein